MVKLLLPPMLGIFYHLFNISYFLRLSAIFCFLTPDKRYIMYSIKIKRYRYRYPVPVRDDTQNNKIERQQMFKNEIIKKVNPPYDLPL